MAEGTPSDCPGPDASGRAGLAWQQTTARLRHLDMGVARAMADWRLSYTVKTQYFCPFCGKQEMWQAPDLDDQETGSSTLCRACDEQVNGLPEPAQPPPRHWWDPVEVK